MTEFQELHEKLEKVDIKEDYPGDEIADAERNASGYGSHGRHGGRKWKEIDAPESPGSLSDKVISMFEENGFTVNKPQKSVTGTHYEFVDKGGEMVKVFISDPVSGGQYP